MSEHTKGKLVVDTFSVQAFLLDEKERGVAFEISKEDARRLAACWNMFPGIDTDVIEIMPTFVEFQQANEQTLHETLCELNAARALLREVVDMVPSEEYNDTIRKADAYLDACDTLEGKC